MILFLVKYSPSIRDLSSVKPGWDEFMEERFFLIISLNFHSVNFLLAHFSLIRYMWDYLIQLFRLDKIITKKLFRDFLM